MTDEQCVKIYLDFLKEISRQGYSQDLMEIASNMLLVVPLEFLEQATNKFTEIAKLGLPERDYHYEISQVFEKLMGY